MLPQPLPDALAHLLPDRLDLHRRDRFRRKRFEQQGLRLAQRDTPGFDSILPSVFCAPGATTTLPW